MVLGNVAASPLHGSSRSNQVSAISSALRRTPCCLGRRFGGDITIIEQARRSSLLYLLTSVHVRPLPAPKSSKKVRKLGPSERQEKNTNLPPRGQTRCRRYYSSTLNLKTRLIKIFRDLPGQVATKLETSGLLYTTQGDGSASQTGVG